MNGSPEELDERLSFKMEYFGERLNRVFACFCSALEIEEEVDYRGDSACDPRAWALQTIHNACLDTTLMALRDLDDFFGGSGQKDRRPDDIRAVDFGFSGCHPVLTGVDRERISKLIAHITTTGAAEQGFRWDILELTTKCLAQCDEFLSWIEKRYGLEHFDLHSAAIVIRARSQLQMEYILTEAKIRRAASRKQKP